MIEEAIESFKIVAPMLVPEMFSINNIKDVEIREDDALLSYSIPKPLDFEEVLNALEDQMEFILLYYHQAVGGIVFGQSCCAYSNPKYGHMIKINACTNANGMCDSIDVTLYDSLDFMCQEILEELRLKSERGCFLYHKEECDVMSDFL